MQVYEKIKEKENKYNQGRGLSKERIEELKNKRRGDALEGEEKNDWDAFEFYNKITEKSKTLANYLADTIDSTVSEDIGEP